MSNEDYREKIEEHRQSIELEEQQSSRMSRSRHNVKKKKKTRKNPLLNILLVLLLGIPLTLLIYVSFFYDPVDSEMAEVENNETGSIVEVQKNNTVSANSKEKAEPKIEETETDDQSVSENKVSDENKDEEAKKAEETALKEQQAKAEEQEEIAKQEEAQKKAEQQKQEEQEVSAGTTHTVGPNENLFRIALKYYKDASGVEKIKEANNLSSDSISVGQTLIIPQ